MLPIKWSSLFEKVGVVRAIVIWNGFEVPEKENKKELSEKHRISLKGKAIGS